ncbi:hypothetical protein KUV89_11615 [Marinobacter hydrocarbonoclasticus]|nr:hypothetical protein [Marinobacter nauticus]
MDRQDRASVDLHAAWHLGLTLLLVAIVLAVGASLWQRGPEVPASVIQSRWLQSINWARAQWLKAPHQERIAWRAPDGRPVALKMDNLSGWPLPEPDCEFLWQAMMGQPTKGLITGVERLGSEPDSCRYRLGERAAMTYFGRSGSVVLSVAD